MGSAPVQDYPRHDDNLYRIVVDDIIIMTKFILTYTSIIDQVLGEKIVTQDREGYMRVGTSKETYRARESGTGKTDVS